MTLGGSSPRACSAPTRRRRIGASPGTCSARGRRQGGRRRRSARSGWPCCARMRRPSCVSISGSPAWRCGSTLSCTRPRTGSSSRSCSAVPARSSEFDPTHVLLAPSTEDLAFPELADDADAPRRGGRIPLAGVVAAGPARPGSPGAPARLRRPGREPARPPRGAAPGEPNRRRARAQSAARRGRRGARSCSSTPSGLPRGSESSSGSTRACGTRRDSPTAPRR